MRQAVTHVGVALAACLFVSMLLGAQPMDPFRPPAAPSSSYGTPSVSGDLSDNRQLGSGFQVDYPVFYGLSTRYWLYDLDLVGIELIAYLTESGDEWHSDEIAELTVRGLLKFVDRATADLYVAIGVTYKPAWYGLIAHIAGGLEWSVSQRLAFNFEVGVAADFSGANLVPFLGGGLHFYF